MRTRHPDTPDTLSREDKIKMGWTTVGIAGAIAWFMFAIAQNMQVGKVQVHYAWVAGLFGFLAALIAGTAARNTFIVDFVGWAIGLGEWVEVVVAIGVVLAVGLTIFAIIPDSVGKGVSMGLGLALLWIILPSAIAQEAVPGKLGGWIETGYITVSRPVLEMTDGVFED